MAEVPTRLLRTRRAVCAYEQLNATIRADWVSWVESVGEISRNSPWWIRNGLRQVYCGKTMGIPSPSVSQIALPQNGGNDYFSGTRTKARTMPPLRKKTASEAIAAR